MNGSYKKLVRQVVHIRIETRRELVASTTHGTKRTYTYAQRPVRDGVVTSKLAGPILVDSVLRIKLQQRFGCGGKTCIELQRQFRIEGLTESPWYEC